MKDDVLNLLDRLGVPRDRFGHGDMFVNSPIDGLRIADVQSNTVAELDHTVRRATEAFAEWRVIPAPKRGELMRLFAEELRANKADLGRLISIEVGKILAEGQGEVQEMIDICEFAVGLSRQLYGLTIASERPGHHMRETWQPIGPVGIITSFNFPMAVWAWNAVLAMVCGNSVIWKPAEKTPLSAFAAHAIFDRAVAKYKAAGHAVPAHLSQIILGRRQIGQAMAQHSGIPVISATGSCEMGRSVGAAVAARLGRSMLELGGNAGMILAPSADLSLALRAILFGAVGTAGQRCTTLRRLIIHRDLYDRFMPMLVNAYSSVRIGDPLDAQTLLGPLTDQKAFNHMQEALEQARDEGGEVLYGGTRVTDHVPAGGYYATPAIVKMPSQTNIVRTETFAPILYVMTYETFDEALMMHNDVSQGLSSCVFTNDMREAELFLSARGSDCGIANVNIGPSGAEVGGAFGGEKDTGGGRASGSDSWKTYMRRQTQTLNYSGTLPLAQGVVFDV